VRRIFAQISPNLPEKTPKKTTPKGNKMTAFLFMLGAFLNQSTLSSTTFVFNNIFQSYRNLIHLMFVMKPICRIQLLLSIN